MNSVKIIGVPLDLGAQNLGVDVGPQAFRHQGIIEKLRSTGLGVEDGGIVETPDRANLDPGNPRLRYAQEIIRVSEELASKTEGAARSGVGSVVLGGDHSVCLGAVAGASKGFDGNLGLIYFDAHGDMNTDETTLTGNIHGMHLASLLGFGAPELVNVHGEGAKIAKENLLHIGASDLDQAEVDLMQRESLPNFTLFDLLTKNMAPLLEMIDALAERVDNIWISLDLDSIDRLYAPGAGMPNEKGLTYREIATMAEYIGRKCNVVGIDVVEYNPLQDEQNKTAELGIELIATFFGKKYSWYTSYLQSNKL